MYIHVHVVFFKDNCRLVNHTQKYNNKLLGIIESPSPSPSFACMICKYIYICNICNTCLYVHLFERQKKRARTKKGKDRCPSLMNLVLTISLKKKEKNGKGGEDVKGPAKNPFFLVGLLFHKDLE